MPKILILFILLLRVHTAFPQWYQTGQSADLMVSGVDFNQTGSYFNHPNGLATDSARLLVCDRFNNRILIWNSLPQSHLDQPDLVLGQPDFSSNDPGDTKQQLNWAGNASLASNGKLAVADTENDRILLWHTFPSQNGQAADVSVFLPALTNPGSGQPYGWPWGVWTDGSRLAAVATSGSALLFWNSFPTVDNAPPDYLIALPEFGTPRNISTDGSAYFFVGDHNAKVTGQPGTFFWNSYPTTADQPYDFYRDEWIKGIKLPDGKLIAGGLKSMYVWNTMPTQASDTPDLILSPTYYKNGDGVDVAYAGGRCFFNNYNGNNVLVFNNVPVSSAQSPDFAIGSPGIAAQTLDSLFYVQNPVPVTDGTRLIVSSDFDKALYVWDQFPQQSGQPYDHKYPVTGNVQLWASTLHQNRFVTGGRNVLSVWTDAALIHQPPAYTLANHIGAALLDDIRGVALDDQFFYLATKNGKLYGWAGIPTSADQEPAFTLDSSNGSTFSFLHSDGAFLCATRPEPPSGVDIYRVADLAAGLTTPFKVINTGQVKINQASQALTQNGALMIASRGDHRILLWENPAEWGSATALTVLGQPNQNAIGAAIGENRLFMPNALLAKENELWVGEFKFSSRILRFSHGATPVSTPESVNCKAKIFPNPCTRFCNFSMEAPENGTFRFDFTDTQGIIKKTWGPEYLVKGGFYHYPLDTSNLPGGLYFLRITGNGVRTTLRVVKTTD